MGEVFTTTEKSLLSYHLFQLINSLISSSKLNPITASVTHKFTYFLVD